MSRKQQYFLVVILILASVSFGGWLANSAGVANPDIYLSIKKNFELFQKIYQEITFQYVDEVDPYAFIKAGIEGMTQKLDPYTGYIEKEENENLAVLTKGKYGGVGMSISKRGDYPTVVEPPFENTPAGRAGIREGDKIVEVAGKETKDESLSKIAERLRGKKGTAVKIKIKRADEKKRLDFRLIRDIIVVQDIQYADFIKDNIGYVRLTRFSKNSAKQFRKAITDLKKKGMKGLILDLRSNPGGLLDAAVEISDLILPRGELIVYTKGRTANSNRKYYSSKDPLLEELKLTVLVNGASASASEIVAGAIQDLDRGLIIGNRTFGKGLVQTLIPFSSTTGLRITTAKYYVPSGRLIQNLAHLKRDNRVLLHVDTELTADSTKQGAKKEYHTKNGRIVYGGGGIKPDIEVKMPTLTGYEIALIRQSMFFNFAVSYAPKLKNKAKDIKITDEILANFRKYLKEKKFTYRMDGEEEIRQLQKYAKDNKYNAYFSQNLKNLSDSVEKIKKRKFDEDKEFIRKTLKKEIAAKLYGFKGQIETTFNDDRVLQTAMEVMTNPREYAMKLGK